MEQKGYTPKMSEQSTSEQTMREYFPVYNMKKLINQVDNAQAAVSRSRQKVQNYLKAIVRSPKSKLSSVKRIKTEQTSAHPDTTINPTTCSRRSVGCILNQSNTLYKYLESKSREALGEESRQTKRYLLNYQIIKILKYSLEEEKKSNRIFEKQLKAKKLLLKQLQYR